MTAPNTPDIDALVKRLRAVSLDLGIPSTTTIDSRVIREAAAALTAQAAEIATLQATNRELVRQVAEANAREARLREAISEAIPIIRNRQPDKLADAEYILRAALSGDPT